MHKSLFHIMLGFMFVFVLLACETSSTETSESEENPLGTLPKAAGAVFNGEEKHDISLTDADIMMAAFQQQNQDKPYGWYFGRNAIEKLLAQQGAVGLRIYGGLNAEGQFSPVVFGVTADGNDLDGRGLSKAMNNHIVILEVALPCPPSCGTPP